MSILPFIFGQRRRFIASDDPRRVPVRGVAPWGRWESRLEERLGWAMWRRPALCLGFTSQVWIGEHARVDFAFAREHVVVEADGEAFHGGIVAVLRDRRRDAGIRGAGYHVLRFPERRIRSSATACAEEVERLILSLRSKSTPDPVPASRSFLRNLSAATLSMVLPRS